jgi:hypothetical protein
MLRRLLSLLSKRVVWLNMRRSARAARRLMWGCPRAGARAAGATAMRAGRLQPQAPPRRAPPARLAAAPPPGGPPLASTAGREQRQSVRACNPKPRLILH